MGRAIVRDPQVFLFDEPLSNLDAALRVQMRVELAKLHQRLGSDDDLRDARPGRGDDARTDRSPCSTGDVIQQVGTPAELYHRPGNRFVARFIGSPQMNILCARVSAVGDGRVMVVTQDGGELSIPTRALGLDVGASVHLGIRPEALTPTEDGALRGAIRLVEYLGGLRLLHVGRDGGEPLVAQLPGNCAAQVGQPIRFDAATSGVHLFDAVGVRIAGGAA